MNRLSIAASMALSLTVFSGCAQGPRNETAPATFKVNFDTSRGPFVVEVTREQAPNGADRFYALVKDKYFDGARFYRVVPKFMVQGGGAADPAETKKWDVPIQDDPVKT